MMLAGGHSESTKTITPQVQAVADQIKPELEEKVGQKFVVYEVLEFRQQVVAGMIYHIKIRICSTTTSGECLHVKVFQPLAYTGLGPEIKTYKLHSTSQDPLETF